jgi:hypothetical protein
MQICEAHESIPWVAFDTKLGVRRRLADRFGLTRLAEVRRAVAEYFAHAEVPAGLPTHHALRQHGLRYLAWRYQVSQRKEFRELASFGRSEKLDLENHEHYRNGELIFAKQIELLHKPPGAYGVDLANNKEAYKGFNPNASAIFRDMARTTLSSRVGTFFDDWVHDSYASFVGTFHEVTKTFGDTLHIAAEGQRYVRWREVYAGSDEGLNTAPGTPQQSRAAA